MSVVSGQIADYLGRASMIRRMFDAGIELKKIHGADKVCDFSLGNPDLPAPTAVQTRLYELAGQALEPNQFGYMPNAGFPWLREQLAEFLSDEQQIPLGAQNVIVTVGAAGGINVLLRAIMEPGDELLAFSPYFVEYGFYAENSGGRFRTIPAAPGFSPDIAGLEQAITPSVRALIINSPNNPTGVIYSHEELEGIAALLSRKSREYGRPIFLISDEPYRYLTYDGAQVPPVLPLYEYAVVVGSFSKTLGLAGERVGYLAFAPQMPDSDTLLNACILTNRILGFVNPPVIGQHLVSAALGSQVDVSVYAARRKAMAEVLDNAGIKYQMPKGAFYFFPEVPAGAGGDDKAFAQKLVEELVLVVPGSGFGCPGHFRMTFCMDETVIRRSADGFVRAVEAFR
ncbi:MAG: pyridoxal phosphate-dependent aminotransferase [Desulfovibrionaceae bacterium]|nr:pyridoxal phosphate-dependent aminotransferase [Desulfovibrionaceae bacterium]